MVLMIMTVRVVQHNHTEKIPVVQIAIVHMTRMIHVAQVAQMDIQPTVLEMFTMTKKDTSILIMMMFMSHILIIFTSKAQSLQMVTKKITKTITIRKNCTMVMNRINIINTQVILIHRRIQIPVIEQVNTVKILTMKKSQNSWRFCFSPKTKAAILMVAMTLTHRRRATLKTTTKNLQIIDRLNFKNFIP